MAPGDVSSVQAHTVTDARQLSLPFGRAANPARIGRVSRELRVDALPRPLRAGDDRTPEERRLERAVAGHLPPGKDLALTLTDNRYSMVSVKRAPVGYTVRIHRLFVDAEPRIVRALARYVAHNDHRASGVLGEYIEQNKHVIRQQPRRPRNVQIRTAGRCHDLAAIFDRLNAEYFGGTLQAKITWGPATPHKGPRHSIKMGSFSVEDRLIRIHPALDQPAVPDYFVAWIVFHEMLHGKHEVLRVGGRRCFHSKEFQADERTFAEYDRACAWERRNIDRLLGA
jgi:hypothetical protein